MSIDIPTLERFLKNMAELYEERPPLLSHEEFDLMKSIKVITEGQFASHCTWKIDRAKILVFHWATAAPDEVQNFKDAVMDAHEEGRIKIMGKWTGSA